MSDAIDIEFSFTTDTPPGKDPDTYSPTLRRYHRQLWSKPLPHGRHFELVDTHPKSYLYHRSELGEFFLSSDAITHSYRRTKRIAHVLAQVPAEVVQTVFDRGSTIGAYTVFPSKRANNQMTINGARGCNRKICDRFDVTLECIRRHYQGIDHPLRETLQRHSDFFALFVDFRGYVDFFFFQDLVTVDYSAVRFHLPYSCFDSSPLPQTPADYLTYQANVVRFIDARARRIREWQ